MAETSKNKIYYNDDEDIKADVLTDMKKMAESTDEAIEKSKYNDAAIKKSISDVEKKQVEKNTEQDRKIVELQTEKAKLETELKEMQEDFYQNSIRGQVSGEYIHVEDSSNCRAKIGIGGNSEQETSTQGKNYFTGNKIPGGINFSVNYSFDNSILKLNGTATNGGNIILDKPTKVKIPAGTYTYTIKVKSGTFESPSGDFAVYIMSASNTFIAGNYSNSGITGSELTQKKGIVSHIFNLTEEKEIYLRCYTSNPNIVFNNLELEIQIESGSVYTEFEQFVPNMPSLDYLSQVKAVGDNVNLANLGEKAQYTSSGFTVSWEDSVFKMSGTASTNLTIPANVKGVTNAINLGNFKAGTYTVSKKILNGNVVNTKGSGIYLRSSNGMIASIYIASIKDRASFTLTEDTNIYIYVFIDSGTQYSDLEIGIKIAEGTEVGEYSKYGQGCVKVTKCNENILDTFITKNVKNQNGEERIGYFCQITKTGKYYLMLNTANTLYFGKSTDLNSATTLIGSTSSTFSTTYDFNEGEYFVLWGTKTDTDKIMIMLSNEQQKYIEHQEQSYIMPVQSEMLEEDYFDFDNEEEVHIWNKLVLTGDEKWIYNSNTKFFYAELTDIKIGNNNEIFVMSNNFKCITPKEMINIANNNSISGWSDNKLIIIRALGIATLTDFESWLKSQYDAGTPVIVYYKQQTPTRLPFTDDQKTVTKELSNARTYKNITNITTDSKAILSLDYAKDLETLLNNTQVLAVNNASEGV